MCPVGWKRLIIITTDLSVEMCPEYDGREYVYAEAPPQQGE
jgi:hypothetical protein